MVESLRERFGRAKGMVIAEYKGMTVAEMSELRGALRDADVEFKVVKNTLARLASEDTPVASARDAFRGPVGVALGYADAVKAAKGVFEYAKKNQKLRITGGVVEGAFYGPEELKAIAELPPREAMLSVIGGLMQAPASKMARLLAATVARLGYGLHALRDARAAQGGQ
ncbi:MAG: 50S ribosomal protein L10 [Thermodesulfovibrionales bacterium]